MGATGARPGTCQLEADAASMLEQTVGAVVGGAGLGEIATREEGAEAVDRAVRQVLRRRVDPDVVRLIEAVAAYNASEPAGARIALPRDLLGEGEEE
jgi:hypothetical protein